MVNPFMVEMGLQLDGGGVQVPKLLLQLAIACATGLALLGFALAIVFMNPSHRKTFFGRLSFRQYVAELWDSRTYAPVGKGLDASRAELLGGLSRY